MVSPVTDPLVVADRLGMGYQAVDGSLRQVVSDASFHISLGESVGFVGESGSGKSTLARALLGYRRAGGMFMGGSLRFQGEELTTATPQALQALRGRAVAMVPQNPLSSLTFHQRVGAQIMEVLQTRARLDRAAARVQMLELLARTGLQDPPAIASRFPHQLSGGQRQRVVIAAALACQPSLLVLDEPTTALDKATESQVLELVRNVRRDSKAALVLVTHDLNVVARVCDRVLVMKDGRIEEHGTVREVFRAPKTAYAQLLMAATLRIDPVQAPAVLPVGSDLLQLNHLHFSYPSGGWLFRRQPRSTALRDVCLELTRGEVLGVIGESGSGKSTLGMVVAGVLPDTGRHLRWEGEPMPAALAQRPAGLLRRIQMIFQDPLSSLNPRKTVGDAVIRPLQVFHGMTPTAARVRAIALLQELGMESEYMDRYPRSLSGGQQQRVAIARAFAAEPDLLVCDEITSALDASIQSQVLAQLQTMQQRRATAMLMITHDLSVIWKMAPRVVVLKDGQVLESGATVDVFARPRNAYTAALVGAATEAHAFTA
ncbi:MAG: ABC transporter ATP-binding protein [Betaproteobacteria bacterium]|nr:ABC transporter ATP-binding protein [Betaproteobacteria bacterium]